MVYGLLFGLLQCHYPHILCFCPRRRNRFSPLSLALCCEETSALFFSEHDKTERGVLKKKGAAISPCFFDRKKVGGVNWLSAEVHFLARSGTLFFLPSCYSEILRLSFVAAGNQTSIFMFNKRGHFRRTNESCALTNSLFFFTFVSKSRKQSFGAFLPRFGK